MTTWPNGWLLASSTARSIACALFAHVADARSDFSALTFQSPPDDYVVRFAI